MRGEGGRGERDEGSIHKHTKSRTYSHTCTHMHSGLGQVWAAVIDRHNEWVGVGTTTPGMTYKEKFPSEAELGPKWGLPARSVPHRPSTTPVVHTCLHRQPFPPEQVRCELARVAVVRGAAAAPVLRRRASRARVPRGREVCVCVCVCVYARAPTDHYDPRADTDSPLGEVALKKYTRHILRGLHYLHTQGGLP